MHCVWFRLVIGCAILSTLVDGHFGLPDNDSDSRICSNFTFSSTERTYLPSEIINITSSCSMSTECPSWNIIPQSAEIKILRNDTAVTGQTCTRNMSIQVVNFGEEGNRTLLLVEFTNPRNERTRVIIVEKSDDGENCYRDEDCYNTGQFCSAVSRCSCPSQFVFVRNWKRCYPDDSTSDCHHFKFSSINNAYLPSDVISMSGTCDTKQHKEALCPSWNITLLSSSVQVKYLRNHTVHDGTKCTRVMEIQVVTFSYTDQSVQLLVEFEHPKSEPIKEINVQRSDDGEFCRQTRDCYYSDQFCSPSGMCTCSDKWVFVRYLQKCYPGIYRVKGKCTYSEQCQIHNSICGYDGCECNQFSQPNFNYTRCIPEGRGYDQSCLTDENCQLETKNAVCQDNNCACRDGYTYSYETRNGGCLPNGAAFFKVGFGCWIAVFIVTIKMLFWPLKV